MRRPSYISLYIHLCVYSIVFYFSVLFLSTNPPTIYLDNFAVVSLRNTSNLLTNNAAIYLDLRIQNEKRLAGIYYSDPLNLTITYLQSTISTGSNVIIERCVIQGFYLKYGEVKHIQASVVIEDLFSMTEQRRKLDETHVFRYGPVKVMDFIVELEANMNSMVHAPEKYHLMSRAAVEVNDNTGTSVLKNIQMKYEAGSNNWGFGKSIQALKKCCVIPGAI
ncbi:unnamed protein product [Lactuca saligna]|uniref:Late embryogenesis abundant protein LEA-2 subgroup domain-containing protein n=1 Tax=Lactuca saligna TaxID=75948 RepID=A0AA35ZEJ9_LACSI|nr:unnamed protein product [Lactuca saligna]